VFAATAGLDYSLQPDNKLSGRPIYRMQIADGSSPPTKAAALASRSEVLYAEPNYLGDLPEARQRSSWTVGGDADAYLAQWAPGKMRLPEAHAITQGRDITVAVLDTGIDLTHPALAGHLVAGYDFVSGDAYPDEEGTYGQDGAYGHGTHVAGLIALAAPEAKIMPLRTLGPDGMGTIWAQAQALRYASDHGADVINLSYSFEQSSRLLDDLLSEITCSAAQNNDCRLIVRPGAVVVAAAGNSGRKIREYPAADGVPGVLGVGASTDADTLAGFSTYGSWVVLAAPGDRILSTVPGGGYATWSGTSMATPLVAGTVALVRAAYPILRPVDTVSRIATTSAHINGFVKRRVDSAAAVGIPALQP
jgi:thermitase